MHMSDALLSPAVGIAMCAVSAAAIGYSTIKIKKEDLSEKKLPLMAVTGAFVFAAQMINFTIPITGSSGHIGGGILLAAMLGGFPALLTISAVLVIQCLMFADGGLLALGCNIFNMGVIPCLIIYPLIFKPIIKNISKKRISIASIISVIIALQLGAFSVVLETVASGITELPFGMFTAFMLPIHLAIGAVEGVVTAGILCFVYNSRPELLGGTKTNVSIKKQKTSTRKIIIIFACAALIVGGGVSYLASSNPDGLEWSVGNITGEEELQQNGGIFEAVESVVSHTAVLADYGFPESDSTAGTGVSGIVGSIITFALAGGTGLILYILKKRKRKVVHD